MHLARARASSPVARYWSIVEAHELRARPRWPTRRGSVPSPDTPRAHCSAAMIEMHRVHAAGRRCRRRWRPGSADRRRRGASLHARYPLDREVVDVVPRPAGEYGARPGRSRSSSSTEGGGLGGGQVVDSGQRQVEELVHLLARERPLLAGALDLDQVSVGGAHHVHVDLGVGVFDVLEIEQRRTVDDAHRDRRHLAVHRPAGEIARQVGQRQGLGHGDPGAGDCRRARAAIGLQDVAVEGDGDLSQLRQVDPGAQRATDEALDLLASSAGTPATHFAARAGVGGAGQHGVLAGHPALALAFEKRRHPTLDAGGHQNARVAELDEAGALGELLGVEVDEDRAQRIGRAVVGSGRSGGRGGRSRSRSHGPVNLSGRSHSGAGSGGTERVPSRRTRGCGSRPPPARRPCAAAPGSARRRAAARSGSRPARGLR